MNGYAPPPAREEFHLPAFLTPADISTLFQKPAGWFNNHRVRKRLYANGFPHPCARARWSPLAVKQWMQRAGSNPEALHADPRAKSNRRRRRGSRAGGYADA
jgi:hypothetical protein